METNWDNFYDKLLCGHSHFAELWSAELPSLASLYDYLRGQAGKSAYIGLRFSNLSSL